MDLDQYDLKDQTAVVTGAARGIGLSFAFVLARANCNVAIIDVLSEPSDDLTTLRSQHGIKAEYYQCDITSQSKVTAVVDAIEAAFGQIDININAAGVVQDQKFLDTTEINLARTFDVNFKGSFFVAQACARSMVKKVQASHSSSESVEMTKSGGCIVFIGSIATHIASCAQTISAYVASKSAVRGLVKPLAVELAPYYIRVNSISPGYIATDMMQQLEKQQPQIVKQFKSETPLTGGARIGQPSDLHGPLLMLCSRKSGGWVTGQDVLVDGGAGSWKHAGVL
ncbi:hypothetical protein MBLNU230_g6171t1 [Neophaeotheca triangularis]